MTNIMEKSCKSYFQPRLFGCFLIRISSRVVFDEVAHVLLAKIGGSDAMLKTGMHSRRKYKVQSSKLLNFPESLKLWSVDDPPDLLVKANEAVNGVIDLPAFFYVILLLLWLLGWLGGLGIR